MSHTPTSNHITLCYKHSEHLSSCTAMAPRKHPGLQRCAALVVYNIFMLYLLYAHNISVGVLNIFKKH